MAIKRILITGAAGFIGFHLAKALKLRGDFVVGLDLFNDYYDPKLKRERAALLLAQQVEVIEGDVCDKELIERLVVDYGITHIVHLAAQAGVRYSLVNPEAYLKSNIDGFLTVLEACRRHPSVQLIYASSSSVYGTNTKSPFSVEDRTDHQASLYGVTKKTNELMAETYHHLYGIPVTGLRFFTVYGPWGRPDMAYFSFTKAILEGKTIDLYDYHNMRRDFTYIDDIVSGVMAAIDLNGGKEIYNLGNHRPEPLSALVESIEEAVGQKANICHLPMQPGDVPSTFADIAKSSEKLGFFPKVSLQEGIVRFVDWYKEYASKAV